MSTTPAPAHRVDRDPTWPVPPRYPGQAAAPAGPVDLTMMYVLHHAFRRDLRAFAAAVPTTSLSDRAAWRRLAARWSMFATMLHHHSAEDAGLWPLLLERATPAEHALLAAMEAEHAEIDPLLAACGDGFTRLAEHADADVRAALAVRLVAGRESLGRHLAHEEREALVLVQRVLTATEWDQLQTSHFRKAPPVRFLWALVPWLVAELPERDRDRLLAAFPWSMRLLHRLGHHRFTRREKRLFGVPG